MTTEKWQTVLSQWLRDFQLLLFIGAILFFHRIVVLLLFSGQIAADTGWSDIVSALWLGMRFDVSTASKWVLVTFFLAFLLPFFHRPVWLDRLRHIIMWSFVSVGVLLLAMDLVFFSAYGDHFNMLVFGLVYDDTRAILMTLWKEYHPIVFTVAAALVVLLMSRLAKYWMSFASWQRYALARLNGPLKTGLMIFPLFVLFVLLARGGMLTGSPLSIKHAYVTQDLFVNRIITNPLFGLWEAFKTRARIKGAGAFSHYWPHGFDAAVDQAFAHQRATDEIAATFTGAEGQFDQLLLRKAGGQVGKKPRHIFLVLMESHSGWTVLNEYRQFGFSPELAQLADQGIYLPGFLPAASGTIGAVNTLVTGLPDNDLNVNYQTTPDRNYASSIARQFRRLGYQSRFFYGGLLGWQRLDRFLEAQGFDEVYGGGAMNAGADMNEWGVDDSFLFDFVASTINNAGDDRPTFNLILTTSNHPPYDLDLDALGFPVKAMPDSLKVTNSDTLKVLGHLWYADQQLGRFVRSMENRFPDSLFAITGDHTARLKIRFPGDSVMEQVAVPLVLYGPDVLPARLDSEDRVGSHIDMMPTLIELVADKGFEYYSFGQNLLAEKPARYGFGYNYIIGREGLVHVNQSQQLFRYPGSVEIVNGEAAGFATALSQYQAQKALGWYRVIRGNSLTDVLPDTAPDKEHL